MERSALAIAAPDKVVPHHAGLFKAYIEGCAFVVDPFGREEGGKTDFAVFFKDDLVALDIIEFYGEKVGIGAFAGGTADFECSEIARGGSHLVALM